MTGSNFQKDLFLDSEGDARFLRNTEAVSGIDQVDAVILNSLGRVSSIIKS